MMISSIPRRVTASSTATNGSVSPMTPSTCCPHRLLEQRNGQLERGGRFVGVGVPVGPRDEQDERAFRAARSSPHGVHQQRGRCRPVRHDEHARSIRGGHLEPLRLSHRRRSAAGDGRRRADGACVHTSNSGPATTSRGEICRLRAVENRPAPPPWPQPPSSPASRSSTTSSTWSATSCCFAAAATPPTR